jgi:hypothetical protein
VAQPGIRQRFYLDGHSFTHWPDSFTPTPAFGESARRVRDGTLIDHTHRALVTDPDVSSKFRFELDWSRLSEADVAVWLRCAARRGPFLFCPWMEWREEFTFLAGESLAGNLQRGSAKDQIPTALLPATPAGDYDAKFYLNDTLSADFAIGAYANGRSAWATTTAATGPGVVSVVYAPIFTVRVVDQTLSLSSFRQGGKFVAEEY